MSLRKYLLMFASILLISCTDKPKNMNMGICPTHQLTFLTSILLALNPDNYYFMLEKPNI